MTICIVLIIIAIILISLYVYVESTGFRIVHYHLKSSKLSQTVKIAFLSDLHNKDYGNDNDILIQKIDEFQPDIVCFAGDMITSGWEFNYDFTHTLHFMEKLAQKYQIYYSPGNHEENLNYDRVKFPNEYEIFTSALEKMGIHYLNNESIFLKDYGIHIYGLNIPYDYFRYRHITKLTDGLLEESIGKVSSNEYSILLAHNPIFFSDYAAWSPDLVLSGHVHGGIVALPFIGGVISPGYRLFPKYDFGLFFEGKSTMLLSRGIGTHTIPLRMNNKAEIVCLTLEGAEYES